MPTIREVAVLAGVSSTTVSHVINNTRFVSAEVRMRVKSAMDDLGYRPNALARSLRRGETHTIGLLLPDSANPFFAEIGRVIEAAAFDQGYNVIFCSTEGNLEKENLYVDVLIKKQVDGIIFVASGDQAGSLEPALHNGSPVVVVDRDLGEIAADEVLTDNLQGGILATRHLIEAGHRRIACLAGPSNVTPSAQRITGYMEALSMAGLSFDPALLLRGDFHAESGYELACELFNQPDPPTAIFACNDMMAVGVLRAALESGLSVGENLAVVGFDDIELASYTQPPLTTVAQPKVEIGRLAIQMLIERINDSSLAARRVILPTRLVLRQSCRRSW